MANSSNVVAKRLFSLAPYLVGLIFIVFGVAKLIEPKPTMDAVGLLGISKIWANVFAICLSIIEIYIGILIWFTDDRHFAARLAFICLAVFSLYLAYLITLQNPPSCGCAGAMKIFHSNRANAVFGLGRNILLLYLLRGWFSLSNKMQEAA